ncbi:MAG: erythromycin biosynthesis sensory transduction protein eryC1 [Proteobacteria bacterium]|nr:MAG: erythromycin biosynthesis sensory transduction protein eryC1 [Pseudomonadota bacterium]
MPFHDLGAQYRAHRAEIDAAVARVLAGGEYVLGAEGRAFEAEYAAHAGARFAVGVASGMAALELGLLALGVGAGDEVAIPALTAVPTAMAVLSVGATPRLVDVALETCLMDPKALEHEIGPRTRAVIPVHLYGQCADMDAIGAIAARHGLAVLEDCAQAHGARDRDRPAGTLGAAGAVSFYPTKNLGAYGDAGAIVTDDAALAERCARLRNYGNRGGFDFVEPGRNERLDDLHAAVLRVKLRHLDAWNERRRANAARYREALAASAVALPALRAEAHHVYHQFVVRCERRDALREHLAAAGVPSLVHYPLALHDVEALRGRAVFREPPQRAAEAARTILSLPIYPELPADHQARVVEAVRRFR